jgi:hypothetical protein
LNINPKASNQVGGFHVVSSPSSQETRLKNTRHISILRHSRNPFPLKAGSIFHFVPSFEIPFLTVVFDEARQRLLCHALDAIPIAPFHRHNGLDRPRLEQPHRVRFCKQVTFGV